MNKIDKTLNRNATETLTFTIEGDYSADTIYLTAKRKVSDSTRLIDHECDSVTYDAETGLSTLTFNILPAETVGITYSLLTYDIKTENSSIDRDALIQGNLKVNLLPRLDSDLVPDAASNVVELDISELVDDTFLYKTTVAGEDVLISKTVAEMKTALGLPKNIMVGKVSSTNIDGVGIITSVITKKINSFSVSETAEFSWAKSGTGYYRFTIPSAYDCLDGNTIINAFTVTVPSGFEITFTYTNTYMQVNLYKDGVLTDLETDTSFTITFEAKVYE